MIKIISKYVQVYRYTDTERHRPQNNGPRRFLFKLQITFKTRQKPKTLSF